jgi:hypothetical protein
MRNLIIFFTLLLPISSSFGEVPQTIEFRSFLYDFFQEPDFQINHISNPYTYASFSSDEEDADLVTVIKNLDNWKHLKGPEHYRCKKNCFDLMIYDNFDKKHIESGKRVLAFEGVENGINSTLYFELINNEWFMVKYESFNN